MRSAAGPSRRRGNLPYRIVIFAKAPIAGQVKTRLAPLLGDDGAAALARKMLDDTCIEAQAVAGASVELCASPHPADPSWTGLIPADVAVTAQGDGDLGARLLEAARRVMGDGDWPLLIGTDCPALDRYALSAACSTLEQNNAIIHPTEDGGYALLGLKRLSASLFTDIGWSGPDVASDTLARLEALGWRYSVGKVLKDIDGPADYEAYVRRHLSPG